MEKTKMAGDRGVTGRDLKPIRSAVSGKMEVPPGIEPGYTDLQSGASPLRHGTSRGGAAL